MKAVVTGGAGFVGSHLCDRLLEMGYDVVCMDNLLTGTEHNITHLMGNPGFKFVRHDVTESIPIVGAVDAVLHFASPASPIDYLKMPIQTLEVGSIGTQKALLLAKEKKARFLLASTSEVYGDPLVNPQPETYWGNVNSIGPRAVYDEAKRFAEAMTMAYRRYHNVDTRIIRIFNTYGPRMRANDGRVVSNFIVQALEKKPLTIYGDGSHGVPISRAPARFWHGVPKLELIAVFGPPLNTSGNFPRDTRHWRRRLHRQPYRKGAQGGGALAGHLR